MNKMNEIVKDNPVIAILRNIPDEDYLTYARALYDGGIRAFEISYTTTNAGDQIRNIKKLLPHDASIGAGTILSLEMLKDAVQCGADFLLSPATDIDILKYCHNNKLALLPGVFSPSDIATCLKYNFNTLKLFPASELSPSYIKSLLGPYPNTEYVAVGGVSPDNATRYLTNGFIGVGIGGSLVNTNDLQNKNWETITQSIKKLMSNIGGL